MALLNRINSISDLKALSKKQLPVLADEIRHFLVENVLQSGGHLSSNLGVVELTIALMYVFDFPTDKIVFDVGHQSYVYKILTGRKNEFGNLRKFEGLCGFPNNSESRFDCFDTGHSSTSISAALGLARARDIKKGNQNVLALIGDGALSGGLCWEALNDLGASKTRMAVVLNDNEMSINKNVGGLSKRLVKMRLGKRYSRFKSRIRRITGVIPPLYRLVRKIKNSIKFSLVRSKIFEQFGVKYIGPLDGHDISTLIEYFEFIKCFECPIIVHTVTKKGRGYKPAEDNPSKFHGIDGCNCSELPSFSKTFGSTLTHLAASNGRIAAITAAMKSGVGLDDFATVFPKRFFDVGIAEEHAIAMAAGLARGGLKPYIAIYSSFLQRAYDQILHDVCLQDLAVTFCIDRAGISCGDGKTHHGIYDLGYLSTMPNMTIMCPKSTIDLETMLKFSAEYEHPLSIRYPKCCEDYGSDLPPLIINKKNLARWTILREISTCNVLCIGDRALSIALKSKGDFGIIYADVLLADSPLLTSLANTDKLIVIEDGISDCGLFSLVCKFFASNDFINKTLTVLPLGFENIIIEQGEVDKLLTHYGISVEALEKIIN